MGLRNELALSNMSWRLGSSEYELTQPDASYVVAWANQFQKVG